jgi:hypothetical protein
MGQLKNLIRNEITMGELVLTFEHTRLVLVWMFLNFFHTCKI